MIKFFELAPSPNNLKVRMALRYKKIPFETVPVDPADRGAVLSASGQELTPVIEDRGIVINDSEAILQYLDANHRDTPRLFPAARDGRRACEAWKTRLDTELVPHWRPVFLHAIKVGPAFTEADRRGFEDGLRRLQDELADRASFHGAERAVCDLRVAEWAAYALPGPALLGRVGLFRKFRELFGIEPGALPGLERFLKPWDARMA